MKITKLVLLASTLTSIFASINGDIDSPMGSPPARFWSFTPDLRSATPEMYLEIFEEVYKDRLDVLKQNAKHEFFSEELPIWRQNYLQVTVQLTTKLLNKKMAYIEKQSSRTRPGLFLQLFPSGDEAHQIAYNIIASEIQ